MFRRYLFFGGFLLSRPVLAPKEPLTIAAKNFAAADKRA